MASDGCAEANFQLSRPAKSPIHPVYLFTLHFGLSFPYIYPRTHASAKCPD